VLFDYVMTHVPADKHAGVDGLSWQKCTPEDSDEEDAEEYLDKFMGSASIEFCSVSSLTNFLSAESLNAYRSTRLDNDFFKDLLLIMCRSPQTPFASFRTTAIAEDLSIFSAENPTAA